MPPPEATSRATTAAATPTSSCAPLWGVERGVYLHLGHVAQAELARISDPAGVRHAIEAVVGQGAADSPAQAAVAALKEQRARLVGPELGGDQAARPRPRRARPARRCRRRRGRRARGGRRARRPSATRPARRPRPPTGACTRSSTPPPMSAPASFAAASSGPTRPSGPPSPPRPSWSARPRTPTSPRPRRSAPCATACAISRPSATAAPASGCSTPSG